MGQRLPMGPQGPASGTLDAPLTQNAAPSTAAPSTGKSDMIRALKDTVRYLRSASTDPSAFVDPRSYHGDGSEDADVMEEMLTEMQALKSRDAASATVLRMAKENLEQRKEQISQLQAELASRAQIAGSTNAELAEQLRQKENELRVAYSQELAGQGRIQQLQGQVDGLQADLDTRRQQDAHMKNMLNEISLRPQDHRLAHMTRFVRALFDRLPPLRWHVGVQRKSKVAVYVVAQYSHHGRKGVGIVIVDTHDNTRRITGGTIPTSHQPLSWLG